MRSAKKIKNISLIIHIYKNKIKNNNNDLKKSLFFFFWFIKKKKNLKKQTNKIKKEVTNLFSTFNH